MPMRESARGHASSRRLPRSQTSRFSLFPPDPSPRLCQYCRPHPFFLHPEAIQDRLFSVFRFCGRRSFLANAKASLSCPDRTVCFARISRSINLLRRDQFSESCRLRPCFFTILSEARSRHCRFSIIFSPSLSAIFCDAQIALVITHFCRKGTHFLLHRNAASQGHEGGRPSNSGCTRAWHTQFSSLWDHFRACPRQVSDRCRIGDARPAVFSRIPSKHVRSWRYRRLQKQGELGGISHGAPSRRGHSSLSHKLPHGSPLE